MGAAVVFTADMTDAADAYRLGYVAAPNIGRDEATDPAMNVQPQAVDPPVFPRDPTGSGWKLALSRIMRFGGVFSVPSGPSPYSGRIRAQTMIAQQRGPAPMNRTLDPRTPAGLVPVDPTYESYLTADDSYL